MEEEIKQTDGQGVSQRAFAQLEEHPDGGASTVAGRLDVVRPVSQPETGRRKSRCAKEEKNLRSVLWVHEADASWPNSPPDGGTSRRGKCAVGPRDRCLMAKQPTRWRHFEKREVCCRSTRPMPRHQTARPMAALRKDASNNGSLTVGFPFNNPRLPPSLSEMKREHKESESGQ